MKAELSQKTCHASKPKISIPLSAASTVVRRQSRQARQATKVEARWETEVEARREDQVQRRALQKVPRVRTEVQQARRLSEPTPRAKETERARGRARVGPTRLE